MTWRAWLVRHPWRASVAAGAAGALGAAAIVASGVMPIKASSGHWPITEWLLHTAMRRSVSTHARLVPSPPPTLDDADSMLRGATHFETGCRPCHGAPGDPLPPIPAAMTPHPPTLADRVGSWTPRELFYIVKHGVKFTGMPAWPAQRRDDEVWAVVSFLRRLPSLDARAYEALARGGESTLLEMSDGAASPATPPEIVTQICGRCHAFDGRGRGHAFPVLAGQRLEYLTRAMRAYTDGRRHSGIMGPIATGLSTAAKEAAVRYYASLQPSHESAAPQSASASRGEAIVTRGVPEQEIPSCADCHVDRGDPVNDAYPRLSGQYASYIAQQLRLLQARARGGSEYVHLMHSFVDRLTDEQIEAVAAYLASARAHVRQVERPQEVNIDGSPRGTR